MLRALQLWPPSSGLPASITHNNKNRIPETKQNKTKHPPNHPHFCRRTARSTACQLLPIPRLYQPRCINFQWLNNNKQNVANTCWLRHTARVRFFPSRLKHRIIHVRRGGYFFSTIMSQHNTLHKPKKKSTNCYALGRFLRGIFSTNIWAVWVQNNCRKYSSKILFGKYGKRLTVQKYFFLFLMAGCEGVSMRCHRGSR